MRRWLVWAGLGLLLIVFVLVVFVRGSGISARREAWPLEERFAKAAWRFLIPSAVRRASNPVQNSPEVVREGLEHWADHCATCHANDGSGTGTMGRRVFPPVPDMRAPRTQNLSDGELFYAIEQGIPFTAMPAWGNHTPEGEQDSWKLVWFIRHLPKLTPAELTEMEALNPKTAAELARDKEVSDFLSGGSPTKSDVAKPAPHKHK